MPIKPQGRLKATSNMNIVDDPGTPDKTFDKAI